jgi:hypothetical protein
MGIAVTAVQGMDSLRGFSGPDFAKVLRSFPESDVR